MGCLEHISYNLGESFDWLSFLSDITHNTMLRHCWFGGRKGIRPVKKLSGGVLAWLSVWSDVRFAYGPANATATHCLLLQ